MVLNHQQIGSPLPRSPFSISLSSLLGTERPRTLRVASGIQGTKQWKDYCCDVGYWQRVLRQRSEQRWALCFDDSYWLAVAFMAAACAGKVLVLPGNIRPGALAELADQFDGVLSDTELIVGSASVPLLVVCGLNTTTEQDVGTEREDTLLSPIALLPSLLAERPELFEPLALSDISLILFTSGSSGAPKPVYKTLDLLDAEIQGLEACWGAMFDEHDALSPEAGRQGGSGDSKGALLITSTVSHQHIYGLLFRVLWPLCTGRCFARTNWLYPEQVIQNASPDVVLITSPALLKRLTTASAQSYRGVFSSGGPLSVEVSRRVAKLLGLPPIEIYGSTETGGIAHRQQVVAQQAFIQQAITQPALTQKVPTQKALTQNSTLSAESATVQTDENEQAWQLFPGLEARLSPQQCLMLRSPYLPSNDWYVTQDACELRPEGKFHLKGRVDRVVKIEEKRISLPEVEGRLSQHRWIADAAVIEDKQYQRAQLAAVLTLSPDGLAAFERLGKGPFAVSLRQAMREWVEPVGIPRRFRFVEAIPVNAQGKRQWSELVSLFSATDGLRPEASNDKGEPMRKGKQ
ncbi:AMP-binding protein [Photobacterium ganghwense]|uniref:AMP-binding protein n=1 Tax=Photobacterium ganghwense TaxID=320778 RepID=UPI0040569B78